MHNKNLSQRRATSVVNYLVGKGIASANLVPIGYGEEQPVADMHLLRAVPKTGAWSWYASTVDG